MSVSTLFCISINKILEIPKYSFPFGTYKIRNAIIVTNVGGSAAKSNPKG